MLIFQVALFSGASVINQIQGSKQVIIKKVIDLNLVMKTLPDRKNLSWESAPSCNFSGYRTGKIVFRIH